MREIKFRVWNTDEMLSLNEALKQEIIYIQVPESSKNGMIEIGYSNVHIMQYTGLKDKNGVEIYEGDILEHFVSKQKFIVEFINGSFMAKYSKNDYSSLLLQVGDKWMALVIGNIYENHKLLEQINN